MKANSKYIIIALAIVLAAWLLGRAYTYKYRSQDTIVVTGLGETEFASDLIVWSGELVYETQDVASGYAQLERNKQRVMDVITSRGVAKEQIAFKFVNVFKQTEPVYNASGNYAGQRFTGYRLSQSFSIESSEVDKVESISRDISALIAQGVSIEAYQPS